jgi:NADPH-dependent 2,4-dienoyl-CoA reductase/sulfur reductase-like enzyme/nitrite reductase/ring-hydroxylating ferredoxin subunit
MGTTQSTPAGPDLAQGIPASDLPEGRMLAGHVGEEAVLLARSGAEVFAIGAACTHYGGPLADGLMVGDTVRCPWHHACFSLRTGEALHAPAFAPVTCWTVEQRNGRIFVRAKATAATPARSIRPAPSARAPDRIVIVGGGAAGFAAAETLRRQGYGGHLVMLASEDAPPVDRPNLSKDYLAGNAPEEWVPLRPEGFYAENGIDLRLKATVDGIDVRSRQVALSSGDRIAYDRLLLATGAEPVRLSIPGADQPHVLTLRSLADCRAIIACARTARRAVVLGASFIGLEVAAALRARGLEVHVVAPEARPMERVLGAQLGDLVHALHAEQGVVFHLGDHASAVDGRRLVLKSGGAIEADLVVAGVGVRPRVALAEKADLAVDRGVVVDAYLETSVPGVFAAGDIARWPDPHSANSIRVEHWVVAQRQGQTAARNMLGACEKFTAVPFFWSQHYDARINYVGHAESWDEVVIEGDLGARDCLVRYKRGGRVVAVAAVGRDIASLQAEIAMENGNDPLGDCLLLS